jgi:hypothetical protein
VAEALDTVSQDRVTRMLHADRSGPTRLELAVRTLFAWQRGDLICADTMLPNPLATAMIEFFPAYEKRFIRGRRHGMTPGSGDSAMWSR